MAALIVMLSGALSLVLSLTWIGTPPVECDTHIAATYAGITHSMVVLGTVIGFRAALAAARVSLGCIHSDAAALRLGIAVMSIVVPPALTYAVGFSLATFLCAAFVIGMCASWAQREVAHQRVHA